MSAADDSNEPAGNSIVVGVDRSAGSAAALQTAISFASRLHAPLHVLHVLAASDTPIDLDGPDWESTTAATVRAGADAVREVLEASGLPDCSWHQHDGEGDPAATLVSLAQREAACMIIVGAHHHDMASRLHALVDGSVAQRLLRISPIPVLVVPHH